MSNPTKFIPVFLLEKNSARNWIVLFLLLGAAIITSVRVFGAGTPPVIQAVNLSSDPLYAVTAGDKPTLALALSVEYPTVGAQYTPGGDTDNTYSPSTEYLGYYDAEGCYTYNNSPTETPATGLSASDYKRFDRTGAATSRRCSNAFSGNFLNWATNSAIDMLRLSLSGGDRYIDQNGLTILQRAVLPNGDPTCMWNSSNFPAKQLTPGSDGAYSGAIPTALISAANRSDVWVANTLNRIYFGSSRGGGCGNTNSYSLGSASRMEMPVRSQSNFPNTGMTLCINGESGSCSFSGIKEVWYGANSSWYVAAVSENVDCSSGCNNVFGDPLSGTAKKVYYRNYSGPWRPDTNSLNTDGFFYSRTSVCGRDSSGNLTDNRDYSFCTRYPNGNYKPTGAIQRYSDQLRMAAFGYLMDQSQSYNNGRYGGVLRAPMKYVGSKTFDINGQDNTPAGGNLRAEWDANSGIFKTNPESDTAFGTSGVINYLNKFGRTGPTAGRYKMHDPVGELYYQALRYMQGLGPTADAISGLDTSNPTSDSKYDGFPAYTNWTSYDPYGDGRTGTTDYACLKSNIVVIGDINTHDGNWRNIPNSDDLANNIPNFRNWHTTVQNFERNSNSNYRDGQNVIRTTANPNGANGSVPNSSQTSQIMGYAYWAHTHDIRGTDWTAQPAKQRPGLRLKTFVFDVNEYGAQNNDSTRRYANQFFMAAKYGGFESDASNPGAKPYNTWGNPFVNSKTTTNDNNVWQKSDQAGEASTYYLQSNARGVLKAFDDIFSRAATTARSIASGNNGSGGSGARKLTQAGGAIYQGSFDTSNWSGDLFSMPVNIGNNNSVSVNSVTTNWSAATQLGLLPAPATSRNIVIGQPGGNASPAAVNFSWSSISSTLRGHLGKVTPSSADDGRGEARLNYLRGDRTGEGTGTNSFRPRTSLLGDIVNSGPAYSGAPTTTIRSSSYAAFRTTYADRTPAVFVGANDGMLHAFEATANKASSGKELFAYIPSWMGPKLAALTARDYINNHQSYVDGTPVVAEAQVANTGNATDWKTVLVSGTGAGGKGVFALDVSNPTNFTASNAMWEFTQADDADMGYVIGQPQIVKLRTSKSTSKYFAAVASGVNNYVTDSTGVFSSGGNPTLFLLDLSKATGTSWALGTNYYKISFPVSETLKSQYAAGLVNIRTALNSDNETEQIYAGDLHGNLWKLDFTNSAVRQACTGGTEVSNYPDNWSLGNLSFYKKGNCGSTTGVPLYMARDASGNVQPITAAPTLVKGATSNTTYVVFGTGKYMEATDKISVTQQSVYAVFDDMTLTGLDGGATGASAILDRSRLQRGTASANGGTITVPAFTWGRASSATDATRRSGWYFDFATSGEREIADAALVGDYLVFGSLIPASTASVGSCSAGGGSGYEYLVNVDTGNGRFLASTVGILGVPLVMDVLPATTYTDADNTGRRKKTIRSQVIQQGSTGVGSTTSIDTVVITGRLNWRQINNYRELKKAATTP